MEGVVGQAPVDGLQGDAQLASREVDAEAAMRAEAEADVPVRRAIEDQLVRARKLGRVAVRGGARAGDDLVLRDLLAPNPIACVARRGMVTIAW